MRYVSLGLLLFAFWLALSGHYTPLLIGIGAVCSIVCVWRPNAWAPWTQKRIRRNCSCRR